MSYFCASIPQVPPTAGRSRYSVTPTTWLDAAVTRSLFCDRVMIGMPRASTETIRAEDLASAETLPPWAVAPTTTGLAYTWAVGWPCRAFRTTYPDTSPNAPPRSYRGMIALTRGGEPARLLVPDRSDARVIFCEPIYPGLVANIFTLAAVTLSISQLLRWANSLHARRAHRARRCPNCGYDRSTDASPVCPECGRNAS